MFRVGIDVGGTFTDLFAYNLQTGERRSAKVLTTTQNPEIGVLKALETADISPDSIEYLVHGTTIATNAIIQRRYPTPALITTEGFRDTIEIGRQRRAHLYHPYQKKPEPYVPRRLRFTVHERIAADGQVVQPASDADLARVVAQVRDANVQSVAVCFLNSYVNGAHELQAKRILQEEIPGLRVATSSEVRPVVRELGRFVTTVVRAALMPVVSDYLLRLSEALRAQDFRGRLLVIKNNGGIMSAHAASERPEELLVSGPAGGVSFARWVGRIIGHENVISSDMGGTSFDVCLIENGEALITEEHELEWERPVIVPMLDIRAIGAGGGSMGWIDPGGSLRVGPESAGADPGPACYGRGGTRPTVTDANLVLGRVDPTLGGKLHLDAGRARAALEEVGAHIGLGAVETADAMIRVVMENMASAIKLVSLDRGRDPRDYVLVSFGGAGPMHAAYIARSIGIPRVVVPLHAGVGSAMGGLLMDLRFDVERTFFVGCDAADPEELNRTLAEMEAEATRILQAEGVGITAIKVHRIGRMRYSGQSYEVDTPIPEGHLSREDIHRIVQAFHEAHRREYGVANSEFPVAFVNLRITATGVIDKPDLQPNPREESRSGSALRGTRQVYFDGGFTTTPVYDALHLAVDREIAGPAIVEHPETCIVVPPGARAQLDGSGNLILTV